MAAILERPTIYRGRNAEGIEPIMLFARRDEHERATGKATAGGESGRITTPTPEDLRLINRFTQRPHSAEELYVGFCDLANDRVDRSGERFPPNILRQFARTAPGCALMGGHDYQSLPLGTWYKAEVLPAGGFNWLRTYYYMPLTDENAHARAMLDAGCYRGASIGFNVADGASWKDARLICDICGEDWFSYDCPHWPLESYEVDGEQIICTLHYEGKWRMVEGSIVYLGCQYDAEFKAGAAATDMRKIEPALLAAMDGQAETTAMQYAAMFQKSWDGLVTRRQKRQRPATEPETKGAVPYKDEGIVEDREVAWDAAAEQAACWDAGDLPRYQRMHTWYDSAAPDLKGSYKLPHHQNDGMKAVWRGVTAAAAVLQGGRGGADIPEADQDAVKAHIARHYQQWDEVAPWLSEEEAAPEPEQDAAPPGIVQINFDACTMDADAAHAMADALAREIAERLPGGVAEIKVGRVLSKANEDALRAHQESALAAVENAQAAADGIGEVLAQVAEQAAEESPVEAAAPPVEKAEEPVPVLADQVDNDPLKEATDYVRARTAAILTPTLARW
jgi:hypothetical protein